MCLFVCEAKSYGSDGIGKGGSFAVWREQEATQEGRKKKKRHIQCREVARDFAAVKAFEDQESKAAAKRMHQAQTAQEKNATIATGEETAPLMMQNRLQRGQECVCLRVCVCVCG